MKHSSLAAILLPLFLGCLLPAADYTPRRTTPFGFPVYTNKPSGRQLVGQHAPATTPALSPEEARKKFTVPDGFEVRLFAAEPDVVNPVAMTWDARGRLWVLELYEYPLGAKAGEKPRDRIKILEDTDGDGTADKVTVFADGFSLATGLQLGYGGVYVGQAPDLLFLEDTKGDDVADKRTKLLGGFGMEDRHELLNGFTWGPDGWLYMTQGVFTHSKVKDPVNPNDSGVVMSAALARLHPRTKKFEVFADGTSNPWGVDFDRYGNAFVSACVIDHLFHLAPGGLYVRQAGQPLNNYSYQLLPSIVDHKHFMAAYAGVNVYQGDQYPASWRGEVLMGNIHQSALNHDHLTPNGSSFKATAEKDFVVANDGWFRPVSSQTGPDGAIWIMDWYDKYPCYQNANADPEGVDRELGRIWRVVYTGNKKGAPVPSHPANMNLEKLGSAELVRTLEHPNVWHRRMAQRLLNERRDPQTRAPLESLLAKGKTLDGRLAALWTLHGSEQLSEGTLEKIAEDKEPAVRAWTARFTGERRLAAEPPLARLKTLAADPDPSVRLAVAVAARQYVSGSLTVNTPLPAGSGKEDVADILESLVKSSSDAADPLIPFLIWLAAEPDIAKDPQASLDWFRQHGMANMPLAGELLKKTLHRIVDTRRPEFFDAAIDFVDSLPAEAAPLAVIGLDGLIEGHKSKALLPSKRIGALIAKLMDSQSAEVVSRAQQLGALCGDPNAMRRVFAKVNDGGASVDDRLRAIKIARATRSDAARDAMFALLSTRNDDALNVEAIRALGEIGGDKVGDDLVARWKSFTPAARRAAAETLASRTQWTVALFVAIEQNTISASDIPATVVRSLTRNKDDAVRARAAKAIGRYRDVTDDKLKLIADKRKVVLAGPPDLEAGREVARKTCLVCHKLHGEGADVGPDLTGVGRSTLDALLANVIDPNQIVGKGYENVEVETKDGRTVSGRMVENTDIRVRLLAAGPKEEIVAKPDVASLRVSELSAMPEGLEQMPDADFRNLIWYILNPPQDNRPLTPALRRELIGDDKIEGKASAAVEPATDGESVALWNPDWRVICPPAGGAPKKLGEYAGRRNVLMTRPADRSTSAALERVVKVPMGRRTTLNFAVAADERGDWELRVLADGRLLKKQIVDRAGDRWKQVSVDLSAYAGGEVTLRLENCANDRTWVNGYWSDLELTFAAK